MVARRPGFTLVEMMIATLVLATLGMVIYDMAIGSTRGVTTDRLTEAQRGLVNDLLERFCQPYSDLPALFPAPRGKGPPFHRPLSLDQTFQLIGVPEKQIPTLRSILVSGKVEGFTLTWHPRVDNGRGATPSALRLDLLSITPKVAGDSPGHRVEGFRFYAARGTVGE
jgi:prepilin-type N-terminal cleavage/methylation domain-containing protein